MKKLRISLINIHGLLKGSGLEIGRDADNGGQTKYIYELAEFLSQHEDVEHVHIFTRLIDDPALSPEYAVPVEIINDKLKSSILLTKFKSQNDPIVIEYVPGKFQYLFYGDSDLLKKLKYYHVL